MHRSAASLAGRSASMGQSAPAPWTFWAYFVLIGAARAHDFDWTSSAERGAV